MRQTRLSSTLAEPGATASPVRRLLRERAIFPVYQPIMDLDSRTVVGVEALARGPAGSGLESPDQIFTAAARAGVISPVDQLCFTRAVEVALESRDLAPALLFVNAEPSVIDQPMTPELLAAVRSDRPFRIMMEYTERGLVSHPGSLVNLAAVAFGDGNGIALDDVGADPSSVSFLPILQPDVVKLERHIVRDPGAPSTAETVALVNRYAQRTGAVVVAEGIETEDDLVTARALGARWGQGWLLGRPGPMAAMAHELVDRTVHLGYDDPASYLRTHTPFTVAAQHHAIRSGDYETVSALSEHILSQAAHNALHSVILGAYPERKLGREWLASLSGIEDSATFIALIGPPLADVRPHRVRLVGTAGEQPSAQATLAVVGPVATIALCVHYRAGGVEYVLTHEPQLVSTLARMLLSRLEPPRWAARMAG